MINLLVNNNIIVILVVFLTIILSIYLFYRIKKESNKVREEKFLINNVYNFVIKSDLIKLINKKIKKNKKDFFALAKFQINDYNSFQNDLDYENFDLLIKQVCRNIVDNLSSKTTSCFLEDGNILTYIPQELDRERIIKDIKKVLKQFDSPFNIDDMELFINVNVAICYYPNHGENLSKLLKNLDIALYLSRREGLNNYKVFNSKNMVKEVTNYNYYYEIKKAIKDKQFFLFYQPIYNLEDKSIYGFEGLIRWNHQEKGLIYPKEFINAMETSGDINWLSEWELEELIKFYYNVKVEDVNNNYIYSINLSSQQLIKTDIIYSYRKLLKKYRIEATNFMLEITNFEQFHDHEEVKNNLIELKKLGFKIAIDAQNLSYDTYSKLDKLPFDIFKINRDFISNEDSLLNSLYKLIIDFSFKNNKIIIQEQIEDEDILNKVRFNNIKYGQGYYLSKPISSDDILKIIKDK